MREEGMTSFVVEPIGFVRAARDEPRDDFWGESTAAIDLVAGTDPECLLGLDTFSHAEILFVFDRVEESAIVRGARHPRNVAIWPRVGIFAQRGKNRPNRLGTTIVRVRAVEPARLVVAELDAVDGTPVLDIKPVMQEFLPRGEVRQPAWATELMRDYWKRSTSE
jgi:tRNA-Thr(GGU) m(6)t(6)A37 methyltransferase TsaA